MGSGPAQGGATDPAEGGFALLEVAIAVSVLLTVVVPTGFVLTTSGRVLAANRSESVAADLASSQLEQARAFLVTTGRSGSLPDPTTTDTTDTVDGVVYRVVDRSGWCAPGSSGAWGDYGSAPAGGAAFGLLASVTWGNGAPAVEAASLITTPAAQRVPTSSTDCPL